MSHYLNTTKASGKLCLQLGCAIPDGTLCRQHAPLLISAMRSAGAHHAEGPCQISCENLTRGRGFY